VVDAAELELDPLSAQEIADDKEAQRNLEILKGFAARLPQGKARQVYFRFLVSPVEILDDGAGNVGGVRIERNELQAGADGYLNARGTGETYLLPAGMVLRSVGYKGMPLPGLPYHERSGTILNVDGRITDAQTNTPIGGEYVVGWAKRGPTGVIGTNKPDAADTVNALLADLPTLEGAPASETITIEELLASRGVTYVTIDGWRILDQIESVRGADSGRPRVKFTRIDEMLDAIHNVTQANLAS
jgi:ferredoxin--NADP+ reductase